MSAEITPQDFVNSFLASARARKLSVVVIYGVQEGTKARMRLVSNVGEAGVKAVLEWIRKTAPEDAPPEPLIQA